MIPVSSRASTIEYAIRDVVVPATKLEAEGHEIIKLNIGDLLHTLDCLRPNTWLKHTVKD